MRFPKKLVAGTAAAIALIAGSAAYAAIPDGGGVIHGCYAKQTGQLRVTDPATNSPKACTKNENALNWNQQGPAGAGAGTVFVHRMDPYVNTPLDGKNVVVQTLSIPSPPAGEGPVVLPAYSFFARATLSATAQEYVECKLMSGNFYVDLANASIDPPAGSGAATELTLAGVAPAAATIQLICSANPDTNLSGAEIIATPVSSYQSQ